MKLGTFRKLTYFRKEYLLILISYEKFPVPEEQDPVIIFSSNVLETYIDLGRMYILYHYSSLSKIYLSGLSSGSFDTIHNVVLQVGGICHKCQKEDIIILDNSIQRLSTKAVNI